MAEVCGGETAIMDYCTKLARDGGKVVAKILETEILDNSTNTVTECCLVNVRLPLKISSAKLASANTVKPEYSREVTQWMLETLIEDHKSFIAIFML
jgi:hypothetical protein